ncbi:MAG: hypothetical protein S4CHLAM6_07130 [Chlamydiae bacterium]|nr:hypothetical protein [Chlamydiota bacterium]
MTRVYPYGLYSNSNTCPAPKDKSSFTSASSKEDTPSFTSASSKEDTPSFTSASSKEDTPSLTKPFVFDSFINGKSPFSASGAADFISKTAAQDSITSTHSYSLILGPSYPGVKTFYKGCSSQDLSNQLCTIKQLVEAKIDCKKTIEPAYIFGSDKADSCTVSVTDQGKTAQVETFTASSQDPLGKEKMNYFLAKRFPKIGGKAFYVSAIDKAAADFARVALTEKIGVKFQENYSAVSKKVANGAHAIFNPEELGAPNYFSAENIDQIDQGKTLTISAARVIENKQVITDHTKYSIESKNWVNKITSGFKPNTGNYIWASLSEATLGNWQKVLDKVGFSTKSYPSQQTLEFGTVQEDQAPKSGYTSLKLSTIERSGDIMLHNLIPAGIGALVAFHAGKFAKESYLDPKKTIGQRAAGALVGVAGIAAGLTLAYERLSHLNLRPQTA